MFKNEDSSSSERSEEEAVSRPRQTIVRIVVLCTATIKVAGAIKGSVSLAAALPTLAVFFSSE
jgi:hypothetical protein